MTGIETLSAEGIEALGPLDEVVFVLGKGSSALWALSDVRRCFKRPIRRQRLP